MTYEVNRGELTVEGATLPLRRGLILLALARAGWRGADGILPQDLAQRLLLADPRIEVATQALFRTGLSLFQSPNAPVRAFSKSA